MAVEAVRALVSRYQQIGIERYRGKSEEETFEQRIEVLRQLKEEEKNINEQLKEIWKLCDSVLNISEDYEKRIKEARGTDCKIDDSECWND